MFLFVKDSVVGVSQKDADIIVFSIFMTKTSDICEH